MIWLLSFYVERWIPFPSKQTMLLLPQYRSVIELVWEEVKKGKPDPTSPPPIQIPPPKNEYHLITTQHNTKKRSSYWQKFSFIRSCTNASISAVLEEAASPRNRMCSKISKSRFRPTRKKKGSKMEIPLPAIPFPKRENVFGNIHANLVVSSPFYFLTIMPR